MAIKCERFPQRSKQEYIINFDENRNTGSGSYNLNAQH